MSEWALKRFWTKTEVTEADGGFTVTLDGRRIKTPAKADLVVPTRAFAQAIADEWAAQEEKVDPLTMPATRAANAAIDKVAHQRAEVIDLLADYGRTDLLCYRAEAPERLVARQAEIWDPLLAWAASELGAPLNVGTGVMFVPQPEASLAALRAPLDSANDFELAALHDLVSLSGSLVIGIKAMHAKEALDLWAASRVDETFQAEDWGEDEEAMEAAAVKQTAFEDAFRFYHLLQARA